MPSVIHSTAHGLVADDPIYFGNVVPDYTGIVEGKTYYVLAAGLTANDFEFSETVGGAPFALAVDITEGNVSKVVSTYTAISDSADVMAPPVAPVTPGAPTLSSFLVSGIVRLGVLVSDSASEPIRATEVQITHQFDSLGAADWTKATVYTLPFGSTEVTMPALGNTVYNVRRRNQDVYGNFSPFSSESTITTVVGSDALSAAEADIANDVPDGIITETKIADGAISTPKLQANSVTANILAATIVLASLLKTADSGRRVELDYSGITLFDTDESILVRIPTNGDPVYVQGQIDANSLISESSAEFRGTAALAASSVMTLTNGVAAPAAPPTAVASVDVLTLTSTPPDISTAAGIGYDSGAGTFWIAADPTAAGHWVAHEYNKTTGAFVRSIAATGSVTTYTATVGATSHVSDSAAATSGGNDSQVATPLTIPSGLTNVKASKVSAYFAGYSGDCTARVAIWDTSNNLLVSCTPFTAASKAFSNGNSVQYNKSVAAISLTSGATYRVGFERDNSSDGFQWDRDDGAGKTTYIGDGMHGDLTGITTDTSHKPNVYLTYTYDVDTRLETAPMIGVCTDGTYVYTLDTNGVVWKYDRTTLAHVAHAAVSLTGTLANNGLFYDATAAKLVVTHATGTTGTDKTKFTLVTPSTLAVSSTLSDTTFSINGSTAKLRGGARVTDALNASTAEYWVPIDGTVYAFVASTAANVGDRQFGTTVTVNDGLTYDGTVFRGWAKATPTKVWKFSVWDWTTASSKYWFCYSWYDSNATGGTHETNVSPRSSLTLRRRERVLIGNTTIPVGGTDDPDKVRVYTRPNSTDPGAGAFKLQVTDALTSRYLTDYNSGGAADGGGTAFPAGTPAELKSASTGWSLKGDGSLVVKSGSWNRVRGIVAIPFVFTSLPGTGTVDAFWSDGATALTQERVPWDCEVVGISVSLTTARTAGTCTFQVFNNSTGSLVGMTAVIDGTTTNLKSATDTVTGTPDLTANSQMRLRATGSGFTPTANITHATVYVAFYAE